MVGDEQKLLTLKKVEQEHEQTVSELKDAYENLNQLWE